MSKFKVGDRVVPVSKSVGSSFGNSGTWNRAKKRNQPFLLVVDFISTYIVCDVNIKTDTGDYFLESDLTPFKEVAARIEPQEKAPVYYTLPDPETEKIEPDYKGFYEFMIAHKCNLQCQDCIVDYEGFCLLRSRCFENAKVYAEHKFIKRG